MTAVPSSPGEASFPPEGSVPSPAGPPKGEFSGTHEAESAPAHGGMMSSLGKAFPLMVVAGLTGVAGLLAMEDPLLAVAGLFAAFLGLVVISAPSLATPVALFLLYSNLTVVAANFHRVPGLVNLVGPGLLCVPLAASLLLYRRRIIIDPVLLVMVLFLVIQILGTLYARDLATAKDELKTFVLEGMLLFFLVTNTVRDRRALRKATWALVFAGFCTSLVPTFQQLTDTYDKNYGGLGQTEVVGFRAGEPGTGKLQGRAAGTIGEQNRYAQNMLMLLPLGYFLARRETSKRLRWLALIFTGITGIGFLLTFSRGGLVAMAMVLALMAIMKLFTRRHLMIMGVGALLTLLALPVYIQRIASFARIGNLGKDVEKGAEADGAVKGRVTEMLAAAMVFADHPLVGVGPGMFQFYSAEYGNQLGIRKLKGDRQAHCLYLECAAETGALGLACFLAMVFITLYGLLAARALHRGRGPPDNPAEDATAYLLALMCYLTSAIFLHLSFIRFFYVILGLAAAAARIEGSVDEPEAAGASRIQPRAVPG